MPLMQLDDFRFIVLTGGPGAGKTAVMEAARQIFSRGVSILPEAASIIYSGGYPRLPQAHSVRSAQRAIFRVQEELESFASNSLDGPRVALCDRGIPDGAAYWPEGEEGFFASIGLPKSHVFSRYHTVIHLRTPPINFGYNHNNPMRTESAEQAAALDNKIERIWAGHPNRFVVPATETFTEKLDLVTNLILKALPENSFLPSSSLDDHRPSLLL
jgi:predicted ATPase